MNVACPKCHAHLSIPDDRLPKGKMLNAACPRCGGAIAIGTTKSTPSPATAAPADTPVTPLVERASYGERSQPQALVCVTEPAEQRQILHALKEAGYAAHIAASPAEAVDRLRFTSFAVVVVREGFDGVPGSTASLLEALANAPMEIRRTTHAVLVGPSVATHDSEAAFAKSMDLTVHPNDLSHFSDALRRSVAETEGVYRMFRETQRTLGRA